MIMLLKDLRLSPMRSFLTGFSMFIGIIAVIASVLIAISTDAITAMMPINIEKPVRKDLIGESRKSLSSMIIKNTAFHSKNMRARTSHFHIMSD